MRGLYSITNKSNGKLYIGKSEDLAKRKREHFSTLRNNTHCNKHLQRAFNKYGEDSFVFTILLEADESVDLSNLEIETIADFDSTNIENGYNITRGGEGVGGYKHSYESRVKMSLSHGGTGELDKPKEKYHFTDEHKENISKGKKVYTEEQLAEAVDLHKQGCSARKIEKLIGIGRGTILRHLKMLSVA